MVDILGPAGVRDDRRLSGYATTGGVFGQYPAASPGVSCADPTTRPAGPTMAPSPADPLAATPGVSCSAPTCRAAWTTMPPSSANRCSGTRSFGPQMLRIASGRPARSNPGPDTPESDD